MFIRWIMLVTVVVALALRGDAQSVSTKGFDAALQPFFSQYCHDCHGGGASEGGLDLDALSGKLDDAANFARWVRIYDRVRSGEMPPAESDQVSNEHRTAFAALLHKPLTRAHASSKGTVYRRLNRREYQNTLNDLFGTNLDLESLLPEDGRSHEFDNVGESLNLSMVQLQRYLDAIDAVLDAAIEKTTSAVQPQTKVANYKDTREGETHIGKSWKLASDGAVVFFRVPGYPTGMLRTADVRKDGRYRIRVTGYAYQSQQPVTFSVGATTFQRGLERPTFDYFSFPPGEPTTIELEAYIKNRYMIDITPWGIADENYEIKKLGVDRYSGRGLAINQVELHGPLIDEFPSRGHRLLFDGLQRTEIEPSNPNHKAKSWYVPKFQLLAPSKQEIRSALLRIATKAFRRPVAPAEIGRYEKLYEQQLKLGSDAETAYRTSVAAIFCSPDFLFLREPDGWLSDYAIASRLSYFLTRTSPDDSLLAAAKTGDLAKNPEVLLAQTRRLLSAPMHERFIRDFTDAWLNLRDIEFTSPDKNLYPEFDPFLKFSMLGETRAFVAELIHKNLPVRNLVRSDFAMLNNRLALHYDIDGVDTPAIQRVELPPDSVRGGLLSQGSILKVSANGTNTSPVTRGVWVMERILGQAPPPPPPGISGVEPDIRGASTLRELLAKHRNVDSCRSCHEMIDPPGFALERFNPIGGWRDRFRSLGEGEKVTKIVQGRKVRYRLGPAVDASGKLKSGDTFDDFRPFRNLMARDEDRLAEALTKKLMTFATGRELGFSDRQMIAEIVTTSKTQGHGVRDLIELVVTSSAFRRK